MKCLIKILICVFMTLNIAQGQQPDKGIALYQEGKYEQAITAWLELESIQGRNSKINYNIHTDAIKNNLIPKEVTQNQINMIYADEADIINVALFGII